VRCQSSRLRRGDLIAGEGAVVSNEGESIRKSPGLGAARRKAVDLTRLVDVSLIDGNVLPLVVQPAVDGVDLAEWTASNREQVDEYFDKHGAILFRGFALDGAAGFERVAASIATDLFSECGDLPP